MRILGTLTAILALALVVSCGNPTEAVTKLVPENTLIYGQITNPVTFFQKVDAFMTASDLKKIVGDKSLEQIASENIPDFKFDDFKKNVDFARPWGFALIGEAMDKTTSQVFVPVRDYNGFVGQFKDKDVKIAGPFDGYAIVVQKSDPLPSGPPAKTWDVSVVKSFSDAGIAVALKYSKIVTPESLDAAKSGWPTMFGAAIDLTKEMVQSLDVVGLGLVADETAIALREIVVPKKGSSLEVMSSSAASVGNLAYLPQLSTSEIIGSVTNGTMTDPNAAGLILKPFLGLLGLSADDSNAIVKLMADSVGNFTGQAYLRLDGDYQPQPDSKDSGPNEVLKGLSLRVQGAAELKNVDAARNQMRSGLELTNRLIASLLSSIAPAKPTGKLPVEFLFNLLENQKADNLTHDQFQLAYKLNEADVAKVPQVTDFIGELRRLVDIRIAYKNNIMYVGGGNEALKDLKAAYDGTVPGKSLQELKGTAALIKYLDDKPYSIIHINVARIVNLTGHAMGLPLGANEDVPGLLASGTFGKAGITATLAMRADEIKDYFNLYTMAMSLANMRK